MSTILAVAAIAAASLLILYLLARRFPVFGESIGFLAILACRVLIKGEWILKDAGTYCYKAFEKSVRYPPDVRDDVLLGVLAHLTFLLLSASILFGETFNTLEALPALLQVPNDVPLPGGISIASGMLFLAVPALFGAVVLECAGVIPYAAGLFPKLEGKIKKGLGIVCLVGCLLSVVVLVLFWIYRALYIGTDPDTANVLTPFLLGGLGLTVGGASIVALWAFVVGLMGLASVVLWLLSALCNGLSVVCSLLPTLFDVLAVHLSGGERSVYERYLPGLPWQVPNTFFQKRSHLHLPAASSQEGQAKESDRLLPQQELEVFTVSEQLNCITLNGTLGARLLPPLKSDFADAKRRMRCSGRVDKLSPVVSPVGFGLDVSPKPQQWLLSAKEQFDHMGENIGQVCAAVAGIPSLHLHVLDSRDGTSAFQMLRKNKQRLPGITQVVVTAVTNADLASPSCQAFLTGLAGLWNDGIVTTTLVVDLSSPLVRSLGEERFFAYVARLLSDLVGSEKHSQHNLSAVALFDHLGNIAPFLSLAVATASVANGKTPAKGWFSRLFTNKAVTANLADLLRQALAVAMEVRTEPETWAWITPSASSHHFALVFDVPLNSRQDRLFAEFEREIIKDRVIAGIKAKREKTGIWGRRTLNSDIQEQIKAFIQAGTSVRNAAKQLHISTRTVRKYK
jgi:hypothetical protein